MSGVDPVTTHSLESHHNKSQHGARSLHDAMDGDFEGRVAPCHGRPAKAPAAKKRKNAAPAASHTAAAAAAAAAEEGGSAAAVDKPPKILLKPRRPLKRKPLPKLKNRLKLKSLWKKKRQLKKQIL